MSLECQLQKLACQCTRSTHLGVFLLWRSKTSEGPKWREIALWPGLLCWNWLPCQKIPLRCWPGRLISSWSRSRMDSYRRRSWPDWSTTSIHGKSRLLQTNDGWMTRKKTRCFISRRCLTIRCSTQWRRWQTYINVAEWDENKQVRNSSSWSFIYNKFTTCGGGEHAEHVVSKIFVRGSGVWKTVNFFFKMFQNVICWF